MIKYTLRALLFAFIIIVIQTTILTNLYFLPILPDLLLILILFISFFDGPIIGMTVAFLSGFILDVASLSPFGLNSFYLVHPFMMVAT
ncbi:MAG: rod shape-determining protein MreD, partial [Spirochaetaceae bacterium]|nr:rod shape-determining protein MreD [Spirochaetaceae bacterium]